MKRFCITVFGLILIVYLGSWLYYGYCQMQCRAWCSREATKLQRLEGKLTGGRDYYQKPFKYGYDKTDKVSAATVMSAGWDGKWNTSDDIVVINTDYNKSKIIGKWIGEKSKQAAKGLVEGLKTKSKFDEEEDEVDSFIDRTLKKLKGKKDDISK